MYPGFKMESINESSVKLPEDLSTTKEIGKNASKSDHNFLTSYIKKLEEEIELKTKSRKVNLGVSKLRPDDSYFSNLDSSLKRNTAFVKKLQNFNSNQEESLLNDLKILNLSKYISEVCTALAEVKMKTSDLSAAIKVCNVLHRTYAEFSDSFLESWRKVFNSEIRKDERSGRPEKLKSDLKFFCELVSYGIFSHRDGLSFLGSVLTFLITSDKEDHSQSKIILDFCRHCGEEYAGLIPKRIKRLAEDYQIHLPSSNLLTEEKQQNLKTLLKDYYESLCQHYLQCSSEVKQYEHQNYQILKLKGEIPSDRKEQLKSLALNLENFRSIVENFAEVLDEDVPVCNDEVVIDEDYGLKVTDCGINFSATNPIWDDEDSYNFYECLIDIKEYLPKEILKDIADHKMPSEIVNAEIELGEGESVDNLINEDVMLKEYEEISQTNSNQNKTALTNLLNELPKCVNRELIDSAAIDFVVNFDYKKFRKKLLGTLFGVSRIRLDLLPFYSRLVATLYPLIPDLALDLGKLLKQDFKFHIRKKDQINLESKIKTVRFIGELVKFKMFSVSECLFCFRLLLREFTHHHIEMCCNLLEVCGRYMHRLAESHLRMKIYLEEMMRKKGTLVSDSRYAIMIENAFYHVDPPYVTDPLKSRPPIHIFIRKLLYKDLNKNTIEKVLRLLRKINWDDVDITNYAVKCLTYAWKVRYFNIKHLASLTCALSTYEDFVGVQVVDGVLEDIRLLMEVNLPKYSQRRISMVKYLGELYNYRVVGYAEVFKVLYSFITFGVTKSYSIPSPLDPPGNLFRIRMVCVLLNICAQYFTNENTMKKLDYFITYFQNYYWFKHSDPYWNESFKFPVPMEFMFEDSLRSIKPNNTMFSSFEETQARIIQLEKELLPQISNVNDLAKGEPGISQFDLKKQSDFMCVKSNATELGNQMENFIESFSKSENESKKEKVYNENSDEWFNPDTCIMDFQRQCGKTDDDFLFELNKIISDDFQERLHEPVNINNLDIAVPLNIKKSVKTDLEKGDNADSNVQFVLLTKRGHKPQYKNLCLPQNSDLVINFRSQEEAERIEKIKMKQLTLDINQRLEEEELQERIGQTVRPAVANYNRDKRTKFLHLKGIPDADLIFGQKKIK